MSKTKVVNLRLESYDIYIGREGKGLDGYFGNRHIVGFCPICKIEHKRGEAVDAFKKDFYLRIHIDPEYKQKVLELYGKTLGCFCKQPNKEVRCHGDVYVDFLNYYMVNEADKHSSEQQENTAEKLKIAVIGSRTFDDKERMWKILDKNVNRISMIISGNAQGADFLGQQWALDRGIPLLIFPAKWRRADGSFDKGAGFRRNRQIIESCDKVIAFHDGVSKGTLNSLEWAEKLSKPYHIIHFKPKEGLSVEESVC